MLRDFVYDVCSKLRLFSVHGYVMPWDFSYLVWLGCIIEITLFKLVQNIKSRPILLNAEEFGGNYLHRAPSEQNTCLIRLLARFEGSR